MWYGLYPQAQITIGPVIENGFYYDFSLPKHLTNEDLPLIEKKMDEIVKRDLPIVREEMDRDEAVKYFNSIGEHYKAEIIGSIPAGETISLYRQGDYVDLCRGPHVPSTGRLRVHKLMKLAGAYWRGTVKLGNKFFYTVEFQFRTGAAHKGKTHRLLINVSILFPLVGHVAPCHGH